MTLAEIVAEGERLEEETRVAHRDYPNEPLLHGTVHIDRSSFYRRYGPRLLAVAKAAVEMRKSRLIGDHWCADPCAFCERVAAFDAAASGETEEKR